MGSEGRRFGGICSDGKQREAVARRRQRKREGREVVEVLQLMKLTIM